MGLDIEITEMGFGGRRVSVRGRLDTEAAPAFGARLGSPAVSAVLFELGGLEYIGSAGIRILIQARKTLEARGGGVAVAHLRPSVRQVFDIVKALPSTDVFETDAELDAFIETMRRRSPAGGAG